MSRCWLCCVKPGNLGVLRILLFILFICNLFCRVFVDLCELICIQMLSWESFEIKEWKHMN